MVEVKFLQLSPGWQKKHLKMHQIDALKYGILKIFLRGSMPPDPPGGVISFSPFSPLTRFHACNFKLSNFKSSILQHSLLPYLQTESNVKSPWQQLSRVWIIIGFIASFIIHG